MNIARGSHETHVIKAAKGASQALLGHMDACKKAIMREEIKTKLDLEKTMV